jgi:hypothetical protein
VIGLLSPIIFSLLLLAIGVHDTWSSTLIASSVRDRCSSTQSPSSGDVHQLLIKLMGLLVAALFLQCFLGLGSSSTFHHCCTDFFVCTDGYWHLDLILWGSESCQDPFLQGPPLCWSLSWCDWSISLIPPSSAPIPLAPSALFPAPTSPPLWQWTSIE